MPTQAPSNAESNRRGIKLLVGFLALLVTGTIAWNLLHGDDPKKKTKSSESAEEAEARRASSQTGQGSQAAARGVETDGGTSDDKDGYFARFGWGSGPGKLGKDRPDEANPEGPMSFTVLPNGGLAILDQVNGRMVLTDKNGNPVKEVKIGLTAPQEIAVGKDGKMAVVDRLVDKRVQMYDENGKETGQLPLIGDKIKEGGAVSGMFVDGKNVYAENAHGILALIGSTDGTAAETQTDLFGRPSKDGTVLLSAGVTNKQQGRAWVSAMRRQETKELWTRELREQNPLLSIAMLDSDLRGKVYVAYTTEVGESDERLVLHCLSQADGHILGTTEIPTNDMPEETFREFSVSDDGTVYHAEMTEAGMNYRAIHCP